MPVNFKTKFNSPGGQDQSDIFITKDYLMDVYPELASTFGARKIPGLYSSGRGSWGELGLNSNVSYSSPVQVGSSTYWKSVYNDLYLTAALRTDNTLWAWGGNSYGVLGQVTAAVYYSSPIQVGSLSNWSQIAVTSTNIFAINNKGELWGIGNNSNFILTGTNVNVSYSSPVQIGALTDWASIDAGASNLFSVKTNGTLWACGYNRDGVLGNNSINYYSSPIQIGALTNWKQVSVGSSALSPAFAVKTDGTLWAWGSSGGTYYQLGNGTSISYSSPVQIGALTNWKQVSTATQSTAAIKTDGTLWAWGSPWVFASGSGIGNGTTLSYSSPVQIGALTNWKSVNGKYGAFVAIKTDGTIWGWGANSLGQLGIGNTISYNSPVQIGSLTTWRQAACGYHFTGIADGYF